MASTTLTTVSNILKEVYEDGINDQLQSEVTALKRIEKTSEGVTSDYGGKYVRFPIRTQRNHGIGARAENEALPSAQTQSYASAQVNLKYLYGAMQLTGQIFELADSNFQAFASALDQEVNGLKEGLRKDLARQVYGTGKGNMATATSGTTTTFVTTNLNGLQYIEIGMVLDINTSADAARAAGVTVTNVNTATGTVTFTPAAGTSVASGDYLVRAGASAAPNNINKEITGLSKIVSDVGVLYNIDPATNPIWAATNNNNSGTNRSLTEALMINVIDTIRIKGGGVPTVGFCSLGVRRSYFALLQSTRRIVNSQEFMGGFKGLEFDVGSNTIPIVEDVDAPANKINFVNEPQLKIYQAADWEFMDRDGSKWFRVVTSAGSFDAYQATMYKYMELGTHRRNAHAVLADITES